ncbi:MAG: alpha-1,4-glucan--maltose-1-phosphate maltosyltransferase [Micrococcales bacterium]|nr:alpha-1,4-glucan--maltose-1-phosphate maltosyltransferase [Micrococcales bacterium]
MPATRMGRIPVLDVYPVAAEGRFPAKAAVGEAIPIRATVFREGHDAFGASAVLVRPDGAVKQRIRMVDVAPGLDRYEGWVVPDAPGAWTFRVEGWSDPYGTWSHGARIKVAAGIDLDLVFAEGVRLLTRAAGRHEVPAEDAAALHGAAAALADRLASPEDRLAAGLAAPVVAALDRTPLRDLISPSPDYPLLVDRELAGSGAWYEMFPRSPGAHRDPQTGAWISGTLRAAADELPRIASMGFDVVYLPPIHPIGTAFRKGRNNTLEATASDPGSPWAIGSPAGGHDAIEPGLGTFDDFDAFVARAHTLGLEVALDLALQCSPDHPWVREHPQWFARRADGSIAFAENPPKKYQDIYPLNFDDDPEGLFAEVRRIVELWIGHGVTAFRVDNPHTKPLPFWDRLLADVRAAHPDVFFLAEAFTRPAMMLALGKAGFQLSYTYFAWRNTKEELEEYLATVAGEQSAWLRPSFWPTTPDILPEYLQATGLGGFAVRAVLAALGSPNWGMYSGYELVEHVARPGAEEQLDNEKYEYKPRDWSAADHLGIALLVGKLNEIRHRHPAARQLRVQRAHPTSDPALVCFSRHLPAPLSPDGRSETLVVVVNLDTTTPREGVVYLDPVALELGEGTFEVTDLLDGAQYTWSATPFVRLDPAYSCAHVMRVITR